MTTTHVYRPPSTLPRLRGLVRLVRPGNLLILAGAVVLGGVLGGGLHVFSGSTGVRLLLAALSSAAVAGAGNAANDVLDVHVDRLNRPDRPIPSGQVSARAARVVWAVGSAAGLLLASAVSFAHLCIAAVSVLALYLYSPRLKRVPLVGNAVVAALAGAAVVFGALVPGVTAPVWVGVAFAFATSLAREIIKDVEDAPGDRAMGVETLPLRHGEQAAVLAASGLLLTCVLASPLPFLYMNYGGIYLLGVLVTDAVLLRAVWVLLERADDFAGRASSMVKWGMVTGILALALYWAG